MHRFRRFAIALATAGLIAGVIGPLPVAAEIGLHGLTLSKGCDSPTAIGDPYTCSYVIGNFIIPGGDSVGDDLTVTSLVDTINKPGSPSSGNILADPAIAPFVGFVDNGGGLPSCVGLGTPGVVCTLPGAGAAGTLGQGSAITITDYSFYTVVAADFTVDPVNHLLTDTVAATWQDLCNGSTPGTPTNCPVGNQTATSGSSTVVQQLSSSTATEIHDAAHAVVTAVVVGTTVHDRVIVTGQPGKDTPTGNVNIDWFLNNSCSGAPAVNSGQIALGADGTVDATGFSFTVNTAGGRSFQAHYEGDATYTGSTGACEPLAVVGADISITPDGVNTVDESHTFTATVNVNDGSGSTPAPDGTLVTFAIDSGPGSLVGPNPCATTGGSCSIDLTSAVTGVTVVSASADVTVGGVPITVTTNGVAPNTDPAEKTFVNARISITPDATNEVGDPHTFTVLVEEDQGDGNGFVAAAGESVTVTLTDSNGAANVPSTPLSGTTDAAGEFDVTFTSASAGQVTGHASSNVDVLGEIVAVETDGVAPNGGDAVKTFVDANIQINPPTATNPVNTNHTFTATVNVNDGLGGGFVPAPDGTLVTFTIDSDTAASTPNPPTSCTTTGGSCTTTITSAVAGTTTVSAHTTVVVGGVTLTRSTDGTGANSGPAVKIWESPPVGQITPTNVDCQQYASGTAPTLATIFYRNGGNPATIHQSINPGVFFYFSTITVAAGDVAQTSQSTTNSSGALFLLNQGHAQVYTADCVKIGDMTPNNGGATGTFTFATAGTYILRLQYQTKSIAGTPAPNPDNPTYTFDVAVNGVEVVPNTVSITLTKT